jgi:GT2 family glycosyltransferase
MNRLSVVIPSKNDLNLIACAEAVRKHEPEAHIIAVDDGLDLKWLPRPDLMPMTGVRGAKPFVYARNCNIGIQAAGSDDVILLNDDALLQTDYGFSAMQRAAEEHPEFGLIAASCNNVGNPRQWPSGGDGLREETRMVCFVCVLIPRRTIDAVGLLDERFVGYGCDDDDYCLRVRNAGLKIGIFDGCFMDHSQLTSTFRGAAATGGDFRPNLQIFREKWGHDNWGNR